MSLGSLRYPSDAGLCVRCGPLVAVRFVRCPASEKSGPNVPAARLDSSVRGDRKMSRSNAVRTSDKTAFRCTWSVSRLLPAWWHFARFIRVQRNGFYPTSGLRGKASESPDWPAGSGISLAITLPRSHVRHPAASNAGIPARTGFTPGASLVPTHH